MSSDSKPRKITVDGDRLGKPLGPYSHAAIAAGLAFISGQGARDPKTDAMVQGGIREQTDQSMRNVLTILNSVGLDFTDVVKVNAYLSDIKDFREFNEAYGRWFGGTAPPARTTLQAVLPREGMLVEIELIAKLRT